MMVRTNVDPKAFIRCTVAVVKGKGRHGSAYAGFGGRMVVVLEIPFNWPLMGCGW